MNALARQGIPLTPDRDAYAREQRRSFTRAITSMALADAGNWQVDPADILKTAWPNDTQAERVLKAAVSPTSTSSYPSITTASVLQSLAPASASAQLFARCFKVELAGVAKVRMPYVSLAPTAVFVAEGAPAPAVQYTLAGVDVGPVKKLLIMAALTGELDVSAPELASALIGRLLAAAATKSVDAAVFDSVAADANRPAGLLNSVTPITATAGGGLAALVGDLGNLAGAMADAGIDPGDMVIVTHPETAIKLKSLASPLLTNTVLATPQVAVATVIGIAPAGVGVGYSGTPMIESSKEGVIHMEDTTPLAIGTT